MDDVKTLTAVLREAADTLERMFEALDEIASSEMSARDAWHIANQALDRQAEPVSWYPEVMKHG